jgi:hypothetical protein
LRAELEIVGPFSVLGGGSSAAGLVDGVGGFGGGGMPYCAAAGLATAMLADASSKPTVVGFTFIPVS